MEGLHRLATLCSPILVNPLVRPYLSQGANTLPCSLCLVDWARRDGQTESSGSVPSPLRPDLGREESASASEASLSNPAVTDFPRVVPSSETPVCTREGGPIDSEPLTGTASGVGTGLA